MTNTFAPSLAPSPNTTSGTDTPRIREANFGDGYSQRTPDGLNYQDRTAILAWDALTQAQYTEINGFFEANSGGVAFFYTLPLESTQLSWMWTSKQPGYVSDIYRSLTVNIKRVYDL